MVLWWNNSWQGENRSATPFTTNLTCIALCYNPNLIDMQRATDHLQLKLILPNFRSSVKRRTKCLTPVTRCLKIARLWPFNHHIRTHVCLNSCRARNHCTALDRTGIYDVCTKGSADKICLLASHFVFVLGVAFVAH